MKPPESPNCPKFLKNVTRLVDGAMSKPEEQEFLKSIEHHKDCIHKLEIEQSYKLFLANKLERKCCSDHLIKCIKEQVEQETETGGTYS